MKPKKINNDQNEIIKRMKEIIKKELTNYN